MTTEKALCRVFKKNLSQMAKKAGFLNIVCVRTESPLLPFVPVGEPVWGDPLWLQFLVRVQAVAMIDMVIKLTLI